MTDKTRFKKNGGPTLGTSLVFVEIAYSDNLQQWLTSSTGKTYDKSFWGPYLGQASENWVWNLFFVIFSSSVH